MRQESDGGHAALHAAAESGRLILDRLSGDGGILKQIAAGDWDDRLTASQAADLADVLRVMAGRVAGDRALAGLLEGDDLELEVDPVLAGIPVEATLPGVDLPLNRKERFYTGTVLPMLVAGDGFAHLQRLIRLCDVGDEVPTGWSTVGLDDFVLVTEYNLAESVRTEHHRRLFARVLHIADTPDVVLCGEHWLLAIEAKMFHTPSAKDLNEQVAKQKVLVDGIGAAMGMAPENIHHVLLLPEQFKPGLLDSPVVTWQQVLDAYRVVGPAYWVGVLDRALTSYAALKSKVAGSNADDALTGAHIVARHSKGALDFTYMGRSGGLLGAGFKADLASGAWKDRSYQVRYEPLIQKNWFPIYEFLAAVSATNG